MGLTEDRDTVRKEGSTEFKLLARLVTRVVDDTFTVMLRICSVNVPLPMQFSLCTSFGPILPTTAEVVISVSVTDSRDRSS